MIHSFADDVITTKELRVHLDHLIKRQSIRYSIPDTKPEKVPANFRSESKDSNLRYDDIRREEHFNNYRKPEFQRETNAWKPEDCVSFLDSVVRGRIIPSVILWRNPDNNFTYILDGAHRLSVLRAWMIDDWGDKNLGYYQRRDLRLIKAAANEVRQLVNKDIGSFQAFREAYDEYMRIVDDAGAPKKEMSTPRFDQATFYSQIIGDKAGLVIQREQGNFESAEQSFLRINRSGQALDDWEADLIEHRRGSYARCIMCIANGGESGNYWPALTDSELSDPNIQNTVSSFADKARAIHNRLFVPPFGYPINDINVPFMVAPQYFQPHKYLFELIPLILERKIALEREQQLELLKRDVKASVEQVIHNADFIFNSLENTLEHLNSPTHNSKSLSIAPLFYFYNNRGQYDRSMLYGLIYWLMAGTDEEIHRRKLILSANRDTFEQFIFRFKREIADSSKRIEWGWT